MADLYRPSISVRTQSTLQLKLTRSTSPRGGPLPLPKSLKHEIPLRITWPLASIQGAPVVLWNHGGVPSSGATDQTHTVPIAEAMAAAGYVVVAIQRLWADVSDPLLQEACLATGWLDQQTDHTEDSCTYWVSQLPYGVHNAQFVIDNLAAVEAAISSAVPDGGPLTLDPNKIVVGGHSGGSSVPLAMMGGIQRWNGVEFDSTDDRPIAFIATGPQGPEHAGFGTGFHADSWHGVTKPMLMVAGIGDTNHDRPPHSRATAWLASRPGGKTLLWSNSHRVGHETMTAFECDGRARSSACERIKNVTVAWLDSVVKRRQAATDWLESGAIEELSGGKHELHQR